ncbi:MAG: protease Do, partial [Terracidiphilus sp.]
MSMTTNSLVAGAKKLAVPAGILATILFSAAFLFDYGRAHAAAAAAGPLDESSVSSLVALDNAVEAVASRVTPAVVNVAVTSRVSQDDQDSEDGGHSFNFGGVNPQDLP